MITSGAAPRAAPLAKIKRSEDGTVVKARVRGLEPGTTYAAHLHNAPCSAPNPGGGHYKHDPAGPSEALVWSQAAGGTQ